MHDFVSKLFQYRRSRTDAFSPKEVGGGLPISWHSETMGEPNWSGRRLTIQYSDNGSGAHPIVVLMNLDRYAADFALPSGTWGRVVDTQSYYDSDDYLSSQGAELRSTANVDLTKSVEVTGSYGMAASSIVILEQK